MGRIKHFLTRFAFDMGCITHVYDLREPRYGPYRPSRSPDLPLMDLHCHTFRLEWATLEVKRARYYYNSFAKIEKVNIFTSFYVIFTVKYAVIEEFCVILQRSSEHVLLKQRSVMLDLRIET